MLKHFFTTEIYYLEIFLYFFLIILELLRYYIGLFLIF